MNKVLKVILIILACLLILGIITGIIAFITTGNIANAEEYTLENDTVTSIKVAVEKRKIISVSTESNNGISTKKIKYKSDSVQDDLLKYTQYIRNNDGFKLTKDMNLEIIPSSVYLAKTSTEPDKLIMMTINYDAYGYTITIQKSVGTLKLY